MSYCSIVPCTAVIRVRARSMISQRVVFSKFTQLPTAWHALRDYELRDYEYTASLTYTTRCECH